MKRFLVLLIGMVLFLAACGEDDASTTNADEEDSVASVAEEEEENESEDDKSSAEKQAEWMEEEEENAETESEEFNEETGKGYAEGLGHIEIVGVGLNEELGIDSTDASVEPVELGPMLLEIESFAVLDIEPDEDAKDLIFDGKDKVKVIQVDMKVENTSDEDMEFYPNSSIMVTDAGEQVESDMFMMGDAGGEFYGQVKKEDQTWWILENIEDDISSVTMIVDPPYSAEDWEDQGEEVRLEFDVLSWEEASELEE